MIEKFNGIFYLAVFIIHFIGFAYYGFRCVFQTKSFLDKYGIDDTGAGMVRFFGSIFLGSVVMAITTEPRNIDPKNLTIPAPVSSIPYLSKKDFVWKTHLNP